MLDALPNERILNGIDGAFSPRISQSSWSIRGPNSDEQQCSSGEASPKDSLSFSHYHSLAHRQNGKVNPRAKSLTNLVCHDASSSVNLSHRDRDRQKLSASPMMGCPRMRSSSVQVERHPLVRVTSASNESDSSCNEISTEFASTAVKSSSTNDLLDSDHFRKRSHTTISCHVPEMQYPRKRSLTITPTSQGEGGGEGWGKLPSIEEPIEVSMPTSSSDTSRKSSFSASSRKSSNDTGAASSMSLHQALGDMMKPILSQSDSSINTDTDIVLGKASVWEDNPTYEEEELRVEFSPSPTLSERTSAPVQNAILNGKGLSGSDIATHDQKWFWKRPDKGSTASHIPPPNPSTHPASNLSNQSPSVSLSSTIEIATTDSQSDVDVATPTNQSSVELHVGVLPTSTSTTPSSKFKKVSVSKIPVHMSHNKRGATTTNNGITDTSAASRRRNSYCPNFEKPTSAGKAMSTGRRASVVDSSTSNSRKEAGTVSSAGTSGSRTKRMSQQGNSTLASSTVNGTSVKKSVSDPTQLMVAKKKRSGEGTAAKGSAACKNDVSDDEAEVSSYMFKRQHNVFRMKKRTINLSASVRAFSKRKEASSKAAAEIPLSHSLNTERSRLPLSTQRPHRTALQRQEAFKVISPTLGSKLI